MQTSCVPHLKTYIAIDLKSFYASVECVERGLNPLTTDLVVADVSRTEKTICLAVSPSLKSYGLPGRIRLFEVVQRLREVLLINERKNCWKVALQVSLPMQLIYNNIRIGKLIISWQSQEWRIIFNIVSRYIVSICDT